MLDIHISRVLAHDLLIVFETNRQKKSYIKDFTIVILKQYLQLSRGELKISLWETSKEAPS